MKAHSRAMTYDITDYIKPVFLNTARHHSRALQYQRPDLNVGAIGSFWKKLKLLFSNGTVNEKLVFIENDEIIRDDKEMSHYLIECFIYITDILNFPKFPGIPRYNLLETLFSVLYEDFPVIPVFLRSKRWL